MSFGANLASHRLMADSEADDRNVTTVGAAESIAASIQKQINYRTEARDENHRLQNNYLTLKASLEQCRHQVNKTRISHLTALRERHGREIEVRRLYEETHGCHSEKKAIEERHATLQQKMERELDDWMEEVHQIVLHKSMCQRYVSFLLGRIRAIEESRADRADKLKVLKERALSNLVPEVVRTVKENAVCNERLRGETSNHDIVVRELAARVRESVAKVSLLY